MRTKILVIDDEEALCEILKFNLEKEGYEVDTANSAEEALEMDLTKYHLFIVDIMMERLSGFDFAKRVKDNPDIEDTPIIFCSALVGEDDKVMGLNMGGDDYVTKPFVISEVLARVRAVLRRSAILAARMPKSGSQATEAPRQPAPKPVATTAAPLEPELVFKELRLNPNTKTCTNAGQPVDLTRTEYSLLHFFLTHRGRVYSRAELIDEVWAGNIVADRTIDANVTRLRRKLGQYDRNIETRTGFGYSFNDTI